MTMTDTIQSQGGKARAEKLSPEERARIAREAAQARWDEPPPKALFGAIDKPIRIANIEVPCFVLDNGQRVITMGGMTDTLNIARGGSMKRGMSRLELFVSGKLIKPFVSNDLHERVGNPIKFRIGRTVAYGFDSDTLIDIAEAVISADVAGKLMLQQAGIAHQCRVITSSLTRIGLIALIDEATGYQTHRAHDELQRLLEAYILPEHRPWTKTIPPEFIREMHRVYGWPYSPDNRGPRYAGKLVRQLIYEHLPKPVLPELDSRNPTNAKYQRKLRHHQLLTEKTGLDHFRTQMISVMALLRASPDKNTFKTLFRRAFGSQMEFDLDDAA
jgi:P63C domain